MVTKYHDFKGQYDFLVFLFIFSLHEISIKGRDRDKTEKKSSRGLIETSKSAAVNEFVCVFNVKLLFFFRTQWTKIDNSIRKLFGKTKKSAVHLVYLRKIKLKVRGYKMVKF